MTDIGDMNVLTNTDQPFSGAGLADSAAQMVTSIENGDWLATGANVAAASIELLGVVDNPVKSLVTSFVGWALEHVKFLDWFLDGTMGDPGAVQNAADTFVETAKKLDGIAGSQTRAFKSEIPYYRGGKTPSSLAFEERVGPRGEELTTLSLQCLGIGRALSGAAALIAGMRGMFRDILAEFAWWLVTRIAEAMSLAPSSFGASLVAGVTDTVIKGTKVARTMTEKLASVLDQLERLSSLLVNLMRKVAGVLDSSASLATTVGVLKNVVPPVAQHVDDQVDLTSAETEAAKDDVITVRQGPYVNEPRGPAPAPQDMPRFFPPPGQPVPPPSNPQQGPGLPHEQQATGGTWTTSGNLDDE